MHHELFLQDLAIVMIVAALATLLCRQFKQPVVLGYILAGLIIGPHTPPFTFISSEETIKTLAELGIVFLMFCLGLEFSLGKLKEVGVTAFIAAFVEIVAMLWIGYELGRVFGWSTMDSIFLGAILSISSTTIIIKALEGLGQMKEPFAKVIFGILIVEDIIAIVLLALLSGFADKGSLAPDDVGFTVLKLSCFLGVLLVGGLILVPRFINYVARFRSNEMLLVAVLGLCFGVSLLAVKLGYSVALGAFLIGAIIAETRQIIKIEGLMHPVRDLFSAVFFVSIGLLIDPVLIVKYAGPIAIISIVVIVGKVVACSFGCFAAGNDVRSSVRVGMGLAQIGEFSFIIAALGVQRGVTSDFLYPIAVAVSAVTTLTTPYLLAFSGTAADWYDHRAPAPLRTFLDAYGQWISQLYQQRGNNMGMRLLRKLAMQIGLNLLLITAIFLVAPFLLKAVDHLLTGLPFSGNGLKTLLWLGAMILSLPMIIAVWRKMEAMGMLVADLCIRESVAGAQTEILRSVLSRTVYILGTAIFILVLLGLSSTILPSWRALLVAGALVIVAAALLYRSSVKLYAKAQYAIQQTFAQKPDHPEDSHAALPALLREAKLETFEITPGSHMAGKLIGEIRMRSLTGASVVGIDRSGQSIINPGPDEELAERDQVLLIGTQSQLEAARRLLVAPVGGAG